MLQLIGCRIADPPIFPIAGRLAAYCTPALAGAEVVLSRCEKTCFDAGSADDIALATNLRPSLRCFSVMDRKIASVVPSNLP